MSVPPSCRNCGTPLPPRTGVSGRPADYCSTSCRQDSYRKRRRAEPLHNDATARVDAAVQDLAQDVMEEARHLLRILTSPDAPLLDPVEQAVALSRSVENLTAGLVGRARMRRTPWDALGAALAMQPDTARRTYRAETVNRRLSQASRRTPTDSNTQPPLPETHTPSHTRSHLAPVLSRLHRASQTSLRALAARLGISPSQASRILSGERFPSWWLTERFAQACGADPQVLRKVWETEKLREDQQPRSPSEPPDDDPASRLPLAIRTLHIKAGRPTPRTLGDRTGLAQEQIETALGGHTPSWPTLATIINALDGDPHYFRTLWEALPPTTTQAVPRLDTPRRRQPPTSSGEDRLLLLFETFGPTLAKAHRGP